MQTAIQYTHNRAPDQIEFSKTMYALATVIDEVRGVFSNIGESEVMIGFFPLDSLKAIYDVTASLGFEKFDSRKFEAARGEIVSLWKKVREAVVRELPRSTPEYHDSARFDSFAGWYGKSSRRTLPLGLKERIDPNA